MSLTETKGDLISLGFVSKLNTDTPEQISESSPRKEADAGIILKYLMIDVHGTLTMAMEYLERGFVSEMVGRGIPAEVARFHWGRIPGNPMSDKIDNVSRDKRARGFLDPGDDEMLKKTEGRIWGTVADTKFEAFDGVREGLEDLRIEGRKFIIDSYASTEQIVRQLEETGILPYFMQKGKYMIVGVEAGDKGEDHFVAGARLVEEPMDKFADAVVFIGDTRQEAEICRNWNIPFIGFVGTETEDSLKNAGARKTFKNWKDLPAVIKELEVEIRKEKENGEQDN